jgi:N utilization substance protein A
LQGEKIDIIPWQDDQASFLVNALAPAEVAKVVMDDDSRRVEVVVPDDQLSLAIGRRGQNVRLASQLTGWTIDILTEQEESERRQEEFVQQTRYFIDELDVDETLAQLLVAEGFSDLEEVAYVEPDELAAIEGFDDELVGELQRRAQDALNAQQAAADEKRKELGVEDRLAELDGLTPMMLVTLGEADVKTLEDFAGFTTEELVSDRDAPLKSSGLDPLEAQILIMRARRLAGWIEDEPEDEAETPAVEEADTGTEDAPIPEDGASEDGASEDSGDQERD